LLLLGKAYGERGKLLLLLPLPPLPLLLPLLLPLSLQPLPLPLPRPSSAAPCSLRSLSGRRPWRDGESGACA